jgi:hypothetical protein
MKLRLAWARCRCAWVNFKFWLTGNPGRIRAVAMTPEAQQYVDAEIARRVAAGVPLEQAKADGVAIPPGIQLLALCRPELTINGPL